MIVDSFDYIACYKGLHPNLDTAIEWLNSHTLDALENGKTIIDGDKVFVNVMDADLRDAEGAAFEYHRRYADLQIDLTGGEYLGWASEGKDEGTFDETADCGFKSAPDHCGMTPPSFVYSGSCSNAWQETIRPPWIWVKICSWVIVRTPFHTQKGFPLGAAPAGACRSATAGGGS